MSNEMMIEMDFQSRKSPQDGNDQQTTPSGESACSNTSASEDTEESVDEGEESQSEDELLRYRF